MYVQKLQLMRGKRYRMNEFIHFLLIFKGLWSRILKADIITGIEC